MEAPYGLPFVQPMAPTSAPNTAAAGGPATLPLWAIGPAALRPYPREPIGPRYAIAGMGRNKRIPQAYGTAVAGEQAPPIDERARLQPPRPADHRNVSGSAVTNRDPPICKFFRRADRRSATGAPAISPEPIGRARMTRHHGSYVTSRSSSPMT